MPIHTIDTIDMAIKRFELNKSSTFLFLFNIENYTFFIIQTAHYLILSWSQTKVEYFQPSLELVEINFSMIKFLKCVNVEKCPFFITNQYCPPIIETLNSTNPSC